MENISRDTSHRKRVLRMLSEQQDGVDFDLHQRKVKIILAKTVAHPSLASRIATVCVTILLLAIWYMGGSSSHSMATPVVVNASTKHTATVIFLHGLGDTGNGWSQAFSGIKKPHIKYVCPNAPVQPVTLNMGMRMPSWFDIRGLDPNSEEDEAGIKHAADILQHFICEEEKKGVERNRIIVGGFSQGGAAALYSALCYNKPPLAGVIGLSTWLPLHKSFPKALKANHETPILQCHGQSDPLVHFTFGELTHQLLKSFNKNHVFKVYPGLGHSSCEEEMVDVQKFIDTHLPPI